MHVLKSGCLYVSQNCRVWEEPLEIKSKLLLKQIPYNRLHRKLSKCALNILQRRRLHNLFGQPVPVLCHSHSKKKSSFSCLYGTSLIPVLPLPSCSVTGYHCIHLTCILLVFINSDEIFINSGEGTFQSHLKPRSQSLLLLI